MQDFFLGLLNKSIAAGWLVLAVIVLRLALKKAPKWIMGVFWAFVAVRLICPFSFESMLSVLPKADAIPQELITAGSSAAGGGDLPLLSQEENASGSPVSAGEAGTDLLQIILFFAPMVWAAGTAALFVYMLVSVLRIRRNVQESIWLEDNVWVCDRIPSPFVLGVFRPRIYLPSSVSETDRRYVIFHEKAHIKRHDTIWKPLGFLLLGVYWFNPLLWIGYSLFCKDIELACDENVLKNAGSDIRQPYSSALISCSAPKKTVAGGPLAFGEDGIKGRVKNILRYKKPSFWILLAAAAACAVTAVCLLTDPMPRESKQPSANIVVNEIGSERQEGGNEAAEVQSENGELLLKIRWNNGSEHSICYGEPFRISKQDAGEWIMLEEKGTWDLPAYSVAPSHSGSAENREKEYNLTEQFSVAQNGSYRFSTEFFFEGDPETMYTVWVDFSLLNPAASPAVGSTYVIAKFRENLTDRGLLFEERVSPVLLLEGEPLEFMISGSDETILVYVYESSAAAAKQQGLVSSDGFRIIIKQNEKESSEIIYEWISTPHWYLRDNTIAFYVGTDPEILDALSGVFGDEFAGGI